MILKIDFPNGEPDPRALFDASSYIEETAAGAASLAARLDDPSEVQYCVEVSSILEKVARALAHYSFINNN